MEAFLLLILVRRTPRSRDTSFTDYVYVHFSKDDATYNDAEYDSEDEGEDLMDDLDAADPRSTSLITSDTMQFTLY